MGIEQAVADTGAAIGVTEARPVPGGEKLEIDAPMSYVTP